MAGEEQELPYRVEMWDDHDAHVEELIALVVDHAVARAAFAEAVKRRPGKLITLRQKSRVLADSRGRRKSNLRCYAKREYDRSNYGPLDV